MDTAATRYVDTLQTGVSKARDNTDKYNQAVAESERRYQELENQ